MGGEIVRYRFEELQALSQSAVASKMYKDLRSEEAALCIMQTAVELGIPPMAALRGMHVIDGRVSLAADLMVALAKRHPQCLYFRLVSSTAETATYETQRQGEPGPTRISYTMEDARRAELAGKGTWKKHPAAMLRARCAAALARAVYPDVLLGIYDGDEMEEITGKQLEVEKPVQESELAEVYPQQTFREMHLLSIQAAKDAETLRGVTKRAKRDLKGAWLSQDAYEEVIKLATEKYQREFAGSAEEKGA